MDPTSSAIPSDETEDQVLQSASSMPSHKDDKLLVISAQHMNHTSSAAPSDETEYQVLQSASPLSMISSSQYGVDLADWPDYRRRRKSGLSRCDLEKTSPKGEKKIMHKETERQRRQEMAAHLRSLRSLLPLKYLKGKRSMADHVYEAVKYIKDMQSKIQELSDKRDELKKLESPNSRSTDTNNRPKCPCSSSSSSCPKNIVIVKSCKTGVEVAISTEPEQGMPLRRVLEVLIGDEGLNVINCTSTTVNGRLIHCIESEIIGGQSVNLSELQQKLTNLEFKGRALDVD